MADSVNDLAGGGVSEPDASALLLPYGNIGKIIDGAVFQQHSVPVLDLEFDDKNRRLEQRAPDRVKNYAFFRQLRQCLGLLCAQQRQQVIWNRPSSSSSFRSTLFQYKLPSLKRRSRFIKPLINCQCFVADCRAALSAKGSSQ